MSAVVLRADARHLPLLDASVDLIVTSPPYFALRSYKDGGEHYDGQIGSEPHPREFLEALWAVTAECWRVLKPTGSMWVNLGDKRSGSGAPGTTSGLNPPDSRTTREPGALSPKVQGERSGIKMVYVKGAFGRAKSKMLLPHRYAIGCEDGLADPDGIGWIVRQDQVWQKLNGLPESVRDRTRDSHEYWFHLTKEPKYFAAIDEIREPHAGSTIERATRPNAIEYSAPGQPPRCNDRGALASGGKVPGSVKPVATEPLVVPEHLGVEHFAAFPSEWPRWIIHGWCPPNGVVLDPFGGTGTTAMVAHALGRHGISVDLSADYCRLARWRIFESGGASKARERTNRERQGVLL